MLQPWPWPEPPRDGAADHLVRGTAIPDVALTSTTGSEISIARLDATTVLFIYPWTGRPGQENPPNWDEIPGAHGSTPQATKFRDMHHTYAENKLRVIGLSGQTPGEQREFSQRTELNYPLLSDQDFAFSTPLKLPTFATGGATYMRRITMIITDGKIDRVFYPVHPPDTHATEVLSRLAR